MGLDVEKRIGEGLCPDLPGRMEQTASWSAWAVGLKARIRQSLLMIESQEDSLPPKAKKGC